VVNSLDARGLYTPAGFSAADVTSEGGPTVSTAKSTYARLEQMGLNSVLAEISHGTGGAFIENNNDFIAGFRRLTGAPEFIYVLGFTPPILKSDGKYHNLTITLVKKSDLAIQARKGYFAPKRETDMAQQAAQDIEDAVFSREVMRDIPIELHTQFFKSTDTDAKLAVVARVDFRKLRYRKDAGRNNDVLTVTSALFDPDGNFVSATEKVVTLRLKDATLEQKSVSGINVKASFDVKVGSYVVRVVVRDAEGQMMAAETGAVEIP